MGLLSQHLVNEGELQDRHLPTVVPMVLYNGAAAWKSATDVADCYGPSLPGLEPYRPRLLYHLVDEVRLKLHPLADVRNLAEALFKLERSRTPADIAQVLGALGQLLQGEAMQPLRRTISVWVRMLLRRKAPRANIDEIDTIHDLLEGRAMLEQTIERWFDEATMKGVNLGMQRGKLEGKLEGLAYLLRLRFGTMPDWVEARLSEASEEQLMDWMARILSASSLSELFGEAGHGDLT